ncbi:hypothetical protein BGZ70_003956 [Mortierella alpina]|uniref:F-box domain-containing protein n=1 Tax=Mortierella alpina TaxID=64518 RepID=A0A9P6M4A4_MORAP|nr:hypothetical protein BGZ70_003956 [Mortierella alpina]
MTARQEFEGDGKASRSYSLASAPLRLLSHSFHSTANTHSSNNSNNASASTHTHVDPLLKEPCLQESSNPCQEHPSNSGSLHHAIPPSTDHESLGKPLQSPVPPSTVRHYQQPAPHPQPQPQLQHFLDERPSRNTAARGSGLLSDAQDDDASSSGPWRKTLKVATEEGVIEAVPPAHVRQGRSSGSPQPLGALERLERLLVPYDIRHSIFGELSLQDIYRLQLTCKLFYWATSDQLIWKRIALDLIQGEFYFDIPKTLPANIPNWKYFCKRHLLRQRNWRRGQVQDIISLDDNYQKLTTLQIMAPYVLTGCDDGRVHLWNISTRTLLHCFQVKGEITWVEYLQDENMVAGLGYDIEQTRSEIRLFSTETGQQIGLYEECFWDLAICAINGNYLVASDGKGRYTTWNWKSGAKISTFKVEDETSITEALYLVQNTILELHYDGMMRLFSIHGECYGRFTLDNILPNHQVSFCWLHNDFSMVVWELSNTMAHIRLPFLQKNAPGNRLGRPISQEEWDAQGAEVYWRHQLTHTCNFAAMGGGRFQLLYVEIFENLMDQVPIRVHSLRPSRPLDGVPPGSGQSVPASGDRAGVDQATADVPTEDEGYGWQHGEYVTAHSLNPEIEKIIQGLRPSRIDCDPEYIVVGLVQGGVRLLQFAPVDEELFEQTPPWGDYRS